MVVPSPVGDAKDSVPGITFILNMAVTQIKCF